MKTKWLMLFAGLLVMTSLIATTGYAGDEKLPGADAVIEKYVKAIGGKEMISAHTSAAVRGTFALEAVGASGDFSQFSSVEHGYRMQIDLPGMGTFGEGFSNGVAWALDPMQGPRVLEGDAARARQHRAVFPAEINYDTMYKSMAVDSVMEFEGKSCYRVVLDAGWGDPRYEYFDVDTGLMAGAWSNEPGPDGGKMSITTVFREYRDFGGQLIPTRLEQGTPMGTQVVTIESVEFNSLDASQLSLPKAVQTLLESVD